jgi:hypothetical protein
MVEARAEHRNVFNDILTLDLEVCDVAVCLASIQPDETVPLFMALDLSRDLTGTFRDLVNDVLKEHRKRWHKNNLEMLEYAAESKLNDYQVECLDLSVNDTIAKQIEPLSPFQSIGTFQEDKQFISRLRFYVIRIKPLSGEPIYFYRSYTPKKTLSQAPFFAIWRGQNEYVRVEETMFLFDKYIDCFSRGNSMFICKKDNFHYIFRYFEEVMKTVRETLETIKISVSIHNFEQFAHDCEKDPLKMAKLRNISKKPYLKKLTIVNIKKAIDKHDLGKLGVEIVVAGNEQRLLYDARRSWVLLRLLDDDYLWSEMTEQGYEVDGKRELK